MAIPNPITDPTVTGLSWAEESERKMQSLLQLFLERYFSGVAFETRADGGGLETKTWPKCAVRIQETALATNPGEPVLDVTFDSIMTEGQDRSPGLRGQADEWLVTVICRVPNAMAGMSPDTQEAEHLVRRLAAHVRWLFTSAELEALTEHGVHHATVERPPALFNAGAWLGRIMTVRLHTYGEQAR